MKRCLFIALCMAFVCLSAPSSAWERSSPNVPPDSGLYRDLDKLIAFGLVEPPIRGQRPWPRGEFARMVAEAVSNLSKQEETGDDSFKGSLRQGARRRQITIAIDRLKEEFHDELVDMGAVEGERMRYRIHPMKDFTIFGTYLDSPSIAVPANNGRGPINAVINPLGDYNLGRQATDGMQVAQEFTSWFGAGRFFSGLVRPRFEENTFRSGEMTAMATVQNANGTFRAGNFSVEFGRDSMFWGLGDRDSLLFSTNPRPLDGIWVTNPTPARLPWVFKHLGRWRYTLYGVNQGPQYSHPWSWVMGYKVSLSPAKYVELGLGHAVQIGGEGAPAPSAVDVIGEFFGFRPAGVARNSPNLTNHIFDIDALVRIPRLRGFELYGKISIDDKWWNSIGKTLNQGCSYLAGFYLPALNSSGSLDMRAEFVRTSPLQYRHSLFTDGFTIDRKLLGTDAGLDADAAYVQLRQTVSPRLWAGLTLAWDYRRSDGYTELTNPDGTVGPVVKISWGPREQRYRGVLGVDWRLNDTLRLHVAAGYERARNLGFVYGNNRNNWLAAVALKWDFDRRFALTAN
ncbi:MAG: capsule assembly Wzi family protein [Pseudomonadota bacterium]